MRITDKFSFRALNSMVFDKIARFGSATWQPFFSLLPPPSIRWQFLGLLDFRVLLVTFYPAVAVAALYGGFGPGLLATVVSAALAGYFWIMPFCQLASAEFADGISLAIFIFCGALISYLAETTFRARARAALQGKNNKGSPPMPGLGNRIEGKRRTASSVSSNTPPPLLRCSIFKCDSSAPAEGRSPTWVLGERDLMGLSLYEVFPEIPERWKEVHRRAMAGEVLRSEADLFTRPDGTFQWFRWEVRPWHDSCGHNAGIVIFSEDITEIKKQKSELRSLNRTLRALSDTIRATIQASDVSELVNAVCRIVAEVCGYPMVWIGFAEKDADKTVRFVAQAGLDEDYLRNIKITWSDTELGRGPAGTAIRTGRPFVCRNISTDPHMKPWREQVMRQGFASSVSLPLNAGGTTLGVLVIYSREPDFFLEDEVKLLVELADNLAFGINGLRVRLAHQAAESGLRESRARLDLALRSAGMGTWHWDIAANRLYFDQQARDLLGMDQASVTNTKDEVFTAIHPDDRQSVQEALVRTLKEDLPFHAEHRALRPDGKLIHIAARGKVSRDAWGRAEKLNGVVWDITERKHMENELRRSRDELELRVEERTADLRSANEKLRQVPSMLIEAQESERQRLAMELHDSVGQTIAALKYRIEHVMACMEKGKMPQGAPSASRIRSRSAALSG